MKKAIIIVCITMVFLGGCNKISTSTGLVVGADPIHAGLFVNNLGQLVLESSVSVPIGGSADLGVGVNWETTFSAVVAELTDNGQSNTLVILWQDTNGHIKEEDFPFGQEFEIDFAKDQWVQKIKSDTNGNIVVFVDKQEIPQLNQDASPTIEETNREIVHVKDLEIPGNTNTGITITIPETGNYRFSYTGGAYRTNPADTNSWLTAIYIFRGNNPVWSGRLFDKASADILADHGLVDSESRASESATGDYIEGNYSAGEVLTLLGADYSDSYLDNKGEVDISLFEIKR